MKTRAVGSTVQRSKLSKARREKLENWNRGVRCDGSWAKDGSHVIDLSPPWLPSGCMCLSECVCVLASPQLYSRPPCAQNTTGFRSNSHKRG